MRHKLVGTPFAKHWKHVCGIQHTVDLLHVTSSTRPARHGALPSNHTIAIQMQKIFTENMQLNNNVSFLAKKSRRLTCRLMTQVDH